MNCTRMLLVGACCALTLTFATLSQAAVLYCFASISSGPRSAVTVEGARTSALAAWVAEARKLHGDRFTAWRLSQQRVVHCEPASGGEQTCEACGRPCSISQVPIAGATPLEPGKPVKPQAEKGAVPGCPPRKGISA